MTDLFRENMTQGVELIRSIADPAEMAEVTAQLRQLVERFEARLAAIPDEPVQRATPAPVEEAIAEPRGPRCYVTRRMAG